MNNLEREVYLNNQNILTLTEEIRELKKYIQKITAEGLAKGIWEEMKNVKEK